MSNYNAAGKKALLLALLMVMIYSAPAARASDGPGSAGAGYLMRPVGPKSIAMGEIKAALEEDPFNWLSNPATMSAVDGSGLGFFHSEWLLDTRYNSLAVNARISPRFTLGGGIVYEYGKDIQGFDEWGQSTELLKNYNYQAYLGFGFEPIVNLSAGVNFKYLRETLSEWSAGGVGFDIGAYYNIPVAGLRAGLTVQNIGSDVKFIEREEPLPTTFRAGAVYSSAFAASGVGFSFGLDFVKPRFEDPYIGTGLEVEIAGIVALRGGWCGRNSRAGDGLSFGAGVDLNDRIAIDYAAAPYGDLGIQHMFSVYLGIQ